MGHALKILFFLIVCASANAATWYVDVAVTGTSANTGTNWANAWTNLGSITGLSAGDTIEISQGVYPYAATTNWTAAGGSTNSPITYKHSREVGRNGLVEIQSHVTKQHWTTFDGAMQENYETNIVTTWDVAKITNNIGFYFNGTISDEGDGGACVHMAGPDCFGQVFKWCLFNPYVGPAGQSRYGIVYQANNEIDGIDVSYCLFTNVYDMAIMANQNSHSGFGGWKVHDSMMLFADPICKNGEIVSAGQGLDLYRCIVNRFPLSNCGEQDNFQIGDWWRIYNNVIYAGGNSSMQSEIGGAGTYSHCYFYGNILCYQPGGSVFPAGANMQFNTVEEGVVGGTYTTNIIVSDFRFFNNTIICDTNTAPKGFLSFLNRAWFAGNTNTFVVSTNGVLVFNNLVHSPGMTAGLGLFPNYTGEGQPGGWTYGTNAVIVDYNIIGSVNYSSNNLFHAFGVSEFNTWSGFTHNTATKPGLADTNVFDFRPTDSTAISAGIDLSAFATNMPSLDTDLYAAIRGSSGSWSIGALEPAGLKCWLRFTNNFADGQITDSSGSGNPGLRMSTTNWPYATNGPNGLSAAFYTDTRPFFGGFSQGDYIALTNLVGIDYITNGTVMLWAYANSNSYNATVLIGNMSTSQQGAGSNSWDIARDGENFRFRVGREWDGTGHVTNMIYFPDDTIGHGVGADGYTMTNWAHYCITWNAASNQLIGYYNGLAFSTNVMIVPWFRSDSSDVGTPWLGIGVNPHGGTPQMDYTGGGSDEFPNNGWFSGTLADVRIYNRTLSAAEILSIAGVSEPPPPPAAPTRARIRP